MSNGTNGQTTAMVHGAASSALAAGTTAKDGFGERSLARQAEMQAAALQAQATASIQAKYVMADRHPRDMDVVRQTLLKDCMRVGFAKKAIYSKPMGGGKVEGPTIRLAESALRAMRNVSIESTVIYDDTTKRTIRVSVIDLEANTSFDADVTFEKSVERTDTKGREVLTSRTNSRGQTTYTVVATEDELLAKQNSAVSRAIRNNGLRIVPADIVEEAIARCRATALGAIENDPVAARKGLVDSFFFDLGVSAEQIAEYLGHAVDTMDTAEIDELMQLGNAIGERQTSWRDALASKIAARAPAEEAPKPDAAKGAAERLAAKVAEKKGTVIATPKPAAPPYDEQELYGEIDQLEGQQAHDTWRKRVTSDPSWEATPADARKRLEDAFKKHLQREREQTGTTL